LLAESSTVCDVTQGYSTSIRTGQRPVKLFLACLLFSGLLAHFSRPAEASVSGVTPISLASIIEKPTFKALLDSGATIESPALPKPSDSVQWLAGIVKASGYSSLPRTGEPGPDSAIAELEGYFRQETVQRQADTVLAELTNGTVVETLNNDLRAVYSEFCCYSVPAKFSLGRTLQKVGNVVAVASLGVLAVTSCTAAAPVCLGIALGGALATTVALNDLGQDLQNQLSNNLSNTAKCDSPVYCTAEVIATGVGSYRYISWNCAYSLFKRGASIDSSREYFPYCNEHYVTEKREANGVTSIRLLLVARGDTESQCTTRVRIYGSISFSGGSDYDEANTAKPASNVC
jgi:hypothetical protein